MQAIVTHAPGGPEQLQLADLPLPMPAPGEVLIRTIAAGVNGPDLAQRRGDYPPPPGASPLIGLEVAGEIVHPAGPWQIGDRVVALTNGGGYAEYVAVPAGQVLPIPSGWDPIDAAALPECWFTVTQTLVMRAGLNAGMTVLVTGAAGGIGGAAIQIARILGATPYAVVSSDAKADYVRSLGAAAVIRRDREDVAARIRDLTGGRGVDRVLDMVGGAASRVHVESLARHGHLVLVSTLAGRNADLPLNRVVANQLTISGSTLRPQTADTKAAIAATLRERFWPALGDAALPRPRVTRIPFAQASAAHRALEDADHIGKLVLVTDVGKSLNFGA